jgi:hypothetical protein
VKPRTFLHTFWQTISSPRYYLDILNAPLTFSARFFLMSYVLLSIVATGLFVFVDMPRIKQRTDQAIGEFQQHFPEDLEVRWTGEELQTNASSPATVRYPSFIDSKDLPANFGYVLPTVTEADQLAEKLPTSAWWAITPQKLFVSDRTGNWSEIPLKDLSDIDTPFSLTKSSLPSFIPTWQKMIDYTLIIGAIFYPL